MNRFEWKDSATVNGITSDGVRFYMLRIALLICSVLAAVYLSQLAMFDVWQNASPENQSILDESGLRAWVFGILALAAIAMAVVVVVSTIRRVNAAYRRRAAM